MNKSMLFFIVFFIVLVEVSCSLEFDAPRGLICELLRAPDQAVITDPTPEFGWIVNDSRRGAVQTAWQILVASEIDLLIQDKGDLWDSGKVLSDNSINVEYQGKELLPHRSYWWKVRTWDRDDQASPYSEMQRFNTGRLTGMLPESQWVKRSDQWFLENRQRPEYHKIAPRKVLLLEKGHYFIDFGKAAFGTLEIAFVNPVHHDSVQIYLGERKTTDNRVDKNPGKSKIGLYSTTLSLNEGQDSYVLDIPRKISHYPNSQVLAEHMPEVTPYRYAEIINAPSEITEKDIRQIALFYYFDDESSGFRCSDSNLNQVWDLCKYTMKMTPFLALYADGNRERMPYEADSYIQQLGHYAVDREYAVARYTLQFLLRNPSWPTEWHMHTVLMAWQDYMQTGNAELLQVHYEDLKLKTLSELARADGLISTLTGGVTSEFLNRLYYRGSDFRDIVDWPPGTPPGKKQPGNHGPTPEGERDGFVFMPYNTVVNAFHFQTLILMEKIARVIGKVDEAEEFLKKAALLKESFTNNFFAADRGIYKDGIGTDHASLHANMFPLAFNLVPEDKIPSVIRYVKSRGMACSVYGAQYLLEALYNTGEAEYALSLMTSESKRSWMNMLNAGSTVTTEAWDEYYKPNLTWNHAWGAAPANIIVRRLMGIQPLEPSFQKIEIKPQTAHLVQLELTTPTIRGPVRTEWKTAGNKLMLKIHIPANSNARIWLPPIKEETLKENGNEINEKDDNISVASKDGFTIIEITAGSYYFSAEIQN